MFFGHASWMQKRGCYIDTGDTTNGGGGDPADTAGTGETGADDSLDTDTGDDEDKGDDNGGETDTDKGDPDVDAAQEDKKPDKPKQTPEFDAVAAQLRRERERAAQLERELAAKQTEEAQKQAQKVEADNKAAIEQEWSAVLQEAEQLRAEGYGERYINEFVKNNRDRILHREELKALRQEREQEKQRNVQAERQRETAHAVKSFFAEMGELRKQYGDLIPDPAGIKDDVDGFMQYTKQLPPEMVEKIARGYSPTDAFLVVSHGKISTREKSLEQKRTVANLSDRQRRGITSEGEGTAVSYGVDVNNEMAEAFGNDPKEIAKYVKQQTKSRR